MVKDIGTDFVGGLRSGQYYLGAEPLLLKIVRKKTFRVSKSQNPRTDTILTLY